MKILHNATIHTLDPKCPMASVIVIAGERVLAVGGPDCSNLSRRRVARIWMGASFCLVSLTPTWHLEKYALGLQKLDLNGKTDEECQRLVVGRSNGSAAWILGQGWSGEKPLFAGLAGDTPVYLTVHSLHAAWANAGRPPHGWNRPRDA